MIYGGDPLFEIIANELLGDGQTPGRLFTPENETALAAWYQGEGRVKIFDKPKPENEVLTHET